MSAISYQTLSQYKGLIGEKQALAYLKSKGFEVRFFSGILQYILHIIRSEIGKHEGCVLVDAPKKFSDYLRPKYKKRIRKTFSSEAQRNFFENPENLLSFIGFLSAWEEDSLVPSGKVLKAKEGSGAYHVWERTGDYEALYFRSSNFGFDFIAKKDKKFYLVEVKTNRAILQDYQRKMLEKSKEFGFIPVVLRVKVDISIPLDKIRFVQL
jgi:hypothetical protein